MNEFNIIDKLSVEVLYFITLQIRRDAVTSFICGIQQEFLVIHTHTGITRKLGFWPLGCNPCKKSYRRP